VSFFIYSDVISDNKIFSSKYNNGNEKLMELLIRKLETTTSMPEDIIVKQDETGDVMFFLAKGDGEVRVRDHQRNDKRVKILPPGSHFGEICLITNSRRTASVKSLNYCTIAQLDRDHFKEITKQHPEVITKMKEGLREYQDNYKLFVKRMVLSIPYLRQLPDQIVEEILYSLKQDHYDAEKYLVRAGDACHSIIFIVEGQIELVAKLQDGDGVMDRFNAGAVMFMHGLLSNEVHAYSAKAVTTVKVLTLSKWTLTDLRKMSQALDDKLAEVEEYCNIFKVPAMDFRLFDDGLSGLYGTVLRQEKVLRRFKFVGLKVLKDILERRRKPRLFTLFQQLKMEKKTQERGSSLDHNTRRTLLGGMEKVLKQLTLQSFAVNHLDMNVAKLVKHQADESCFSKSSFLDSSISVDGDVNLGGLTAPISLSRGTTQNSMKESRPTSKRGAKDWE